METLKVESLGQRGGEAVGVGSLTPHLEASGHLTAQTLEGMWLHPTWEAGEAAVDQGSQPPVTYSISLLSGKAWVVSVR